MTFYEAALRVLEDAKAPLHAAEITRRSLDKNLLSHIGKLPEVTMLSRLAAMAKRSRDRKVIVTARDTFALTDWMLPEDPDALALTGVPEPNPEADLPPLRPVERHPEPRSEYLRSIGRQSERYRRRDDEGKKKKFPPLGEVAFELLTENSGAATPAELLARLKSRGLTADDLSATALLDALADDNQKRLDQGRKPQFAAVRAEAGDLQLSVEPQTEGGPTALELQAAFCKAVGLTFDHGKVTLKSQRFERGAALPAASPEDGLLVQTARTAGKDARRAMARVMRRKLVELDSGAFEKACVKMLHGLHFRELKVAKRTKEGPLLTARKRDGSLELRFAVRILKGNVSVERRHVQELRRDLGHYAAQLGLVVSAGEARGDARSEATAGALVMVWCGDGLAEKFFEAHVGVSVTKIELFEVDEAFFEQAKRDGEEAQRRREERHRERDEGGPGGGEGDDASAAQGEDSAAAAPHDAQGGEQAAQGDPQGSDDEEGDDEGEEGGEENLVSAGASAEGGPQGEGKRRRRRRRRRRSGRRPDGSLGVEGASAAPGGAPAGGGEAKPSAPPPPPAGDPGGGTPA